MLLAGSVASPALTAAGATTIELGDYATSEATATMVLQTGPVPYEVLLRAAQFAGGVPALVHALAAGVTELALLPEEPSDMLRCMGPMADELRNAVDLALTSPDRADRFFELSDGQPHPGRPEVDVDLRMAGLIRPARASLPGEVVLRCPALAAVAT
jgi:hypothetical protein